MCDYVVAGNSHIFHKNIISDRDEIFKFLLKTRLVNFAEATFAIDF